MSFNLCFILFEGNFIMKLFLLLVFVKIPCHSISGVPRKAYLL